MAGSVLQPDDLVSTGGSSPLSRVFRRVGGWVGYQERRPSGPVPPESEKRLPSPTPRLEELDAAIATFMARKVALNRANGTLDFYRYRLAAFRKYLVHEGLSIQPSHITAQTVLGFITHERQRVSDETAADGYVALHTFCNHLVQEKVLVASPMEGMSPPRTKAKIVPTFKPKEVEAMLLACDDRFMGRRNKAVMQVLYDCGLRVSELCALRLRDVDWDLRTLRVLGKGRKERTVPFGDVSCELLKRYVKGRSTVARSDALFVREDGEPLGRHGVNCFIRARGREAGIDGVRLSAHTFRHSFAVNYIRNGGDPFSLQLILGHTDMTMTRRYVLLAAEDVIEKHRIFSPGDRLNVL